MCRQSTSGCWCFKRTLSDADVAKNDLILSQSRYFEPNGKDETLPMRFCCCGKEADERLKKVLAGLGLEV
jgi:hypothetical protein